MYELSRPSESVSSYFLDILLKDVRKRSISDFSKKLTCWFPSKISFQKMPATGNAASARLPVQPIGKLCLTRADFGVHGRNRSAKTGDYRFKLHTKAYTFGKLPEIIDIK